MTFFSQLITVTFLYLVLFACQYPLSQNNSSTPVVSQEIPEQAIDNNPEKMASKLTISSQGIGDAQVGMTYEELKQNLN